MNHAMKWASVNRLKERIEKRLGLGYPEAEADVAVAIELLHHYLADATHLRVEKRLMWREVNLHEDAPALIAYRIGNRSVFRVSPRAWRWALAAVFAIATFSTMLHALVVRLWP